MKLFGFVLGVVLFSLLSCAEKESLNLISDDCSQKIKDLELKYKVTIVNESKRFLAEDDIIRIEQEIKKIKTTLEEEQSNCDVQVERDMTKSFAPFRKITINKRIYNLTWLNVVAYNEPYQISSYLTGATIYSYLQLPPIIEDLDMNAMSFIFDCTFTIEVADLVGIKITMSGSVIGMADFDYGSGTLHFKENIQ